MHFWIVAQLWLNLWDIYSWMQLVLNNASLEYHPYWFGRLQWFRKGDSIDISLVYSILKLKKNSRSKRNKEKNTIRIQDFRKKMKSIFASKRILWANKNSSEKFMEKLVTEVLYSIIDISVSVTVSLHRNHNAISIAICNHFRSAELTIQCGFVFDRTNERIKYMRVWRRHQKRHGLNEWMNEWMCVPFCRFSIVFRFNMYKLPPSLRKSQEKLVDTFLGWALVECPKWHIIFVVLRFFKLLLCTFGSFYCM